MAAPKAMSCDALAATDPVNGAAGCHRLPRHKGDHRATLRQVRPDRASAAGTGGKRPATKVGLKRLALRLAKGVEDGTIAPSVAMSRYAAFSARLGAKRRAPAAAPVALPTIVSAGDGGESLAVTYTVDATTVDAAS